MALVMRSRARGCSNFRVGRDLQATPIRVSVAERGDLAPLLQLCLEHPQHGAHDFVELRGLPLGCGNSREIR